MAGTITLRDSARSALSGRNLRLTLRPAASVLTASGVIKKGILSTENASTATAWSIKPAARDRGLESALRAREGKMSVCRVCQRCGRIKD